jgi:hypothetical protein
LDCRGRFATRINELPRRDEFPVDKAMDVVDDVCRDVQRLETDARKTAFGQSVARRPLPQYRVDYPIPSREVSDRPVVTAARTDPSTPNELGFLSS